MKIKLRIVSLSLLILIFFPPADAYGQDTLYVKKHFQLPEVSIIASGNPMTEHEKAILRYRIKKTWTYALLAETYLKELSSLRDNLSKRKFSKHSRAKEKELWNNFGALLKGFSTNDGRILIKLISRQTGMTPFDIVKELRNPVRGFFYNTGAKFFDMSLKDQYMPCCRKEDYWMEMLLRESFLWGELQYAPTATEAILSDKSKKKIKRIKKLKE